MPRHTNFGWRAGYEYAASGSLYLGADDADVVINHNGATEYWVRFDFGPGSSGEHDTGYNLPANAEVLPDVRILVTTPESTGSTKTIDIGTLSSETGGDADGLADGVSVAAATLLKASTAALTSASTVSYLTNANTAKSVSYSYANAMSEVKGSFWLHIREYA